MAEVLSLYVISKKSHESTSSPQGIENVFGITPLQSAYFFQNGGEHRALDGGQFRFW